MPKARILVIDDEALMREYVEEALLRADYHVDTAGNGKDGLAAIERNGYDVVVTDLKMQPVGGLEVLAGLKEHSPNTQCIIMTAYGTVETAVTALKAGANDYILKPFPPDELELAIERALEHERLAAENRYLRAELARPYDFEAMVGASGAMDVVYSQVERVADSRATVLIRGESGTGKELVARAIHHNGPRRDKPFIKVNCAALSAGLLESELFGHEKGSFTGAHERKIGRFELANGGTLLLDEVSEMALELQPKLLRALQEREIERVGGSHPIQVDTRIIATSNRQLEDAVAQGEMREDLFFRLNVIPIQLPPLRDRKDDIPALMDHFLQRFNAENGRSIEGFAPEARARLVDYPWPGNVRELQNAIERAVVLSAPGERRLGPEHFSILSGMAPIAQRTLDADAVAVPMGTTVGEMEKELILRTLDHCSQNRTRAAEVLGISVRTLRNKLKEYNANGAGDGEEAEALAEE